MLRVRLAVPRDEMNGDVERGFIRRAGQAAPCLCVSCPGLAIAGAKKAARRPDELPLTDLIDFGYLWGWGSRVYSAILTTVLVTRRPGHAVSKYLSARALGPFPHDGHVANPAGRPRTGHAVSFGPVQAAYSNRRQASMLEGGILDGSLAAVTCCRPLIDP